MERYALHAPKSLIEEHFGVESSSEALFEPSYNIFTGSAVPVIYDGHQINMGQWSGCESRQQLLNNQSRLNDLQNKACILPISGFYMWKQTVKDPMPFYVRLLNQKIMGVAGIFVGSLKNLTFNVITRPANVLLQPLDEIMPCILSPNQYTGWLKGEAADILKADFNSTDLMPELAVYRVPDLVNDPTNNNPELIQPIPKRRDED